MNIAKCLYTPPLFIVFFSYKEAKSYQNKESEVINKQSSLKTHALTIAFNMYIGSLVKNKCC